MEQIKITGFSIEIPGDKSVGIFDEYYKLEEEFYFEDEEHLKEFKNKLYEAFEIYRGEPVHIYTYEEIKAMEEDLLQFEEEIENSEHWLDENKDLYMDIDAEIQKDARMNFK